jgi:hypothetical protein
MQQNVEYKVIDTEVHQMSSVQVRVQEKLFKKLEDTKWEVKYKLRMEITEAEILNALIYKHLKTLNEADVLEYRKAILGKDK